ALPAAPEADLPPTIELPEVPDVPAAQPATAAPAGWGEARWSRPPNVVDRRTSQGVMVLPAEGPAVVLDGLAARVWEAVDGPVAAGDVAADLVRHGAAGAVAEVEAALRDLRAIGALRELR
ncbi:MAG TPA: PqqD family peptide modification chaperone, partial [Acidimicrobiales bacterium]